MRTLEQGYSTVAAAGIGTLAAVAAGAIVLGLPKVIGERPQNLGSPAIIKDAKATGRTLFKGRELNGQITMAYQEPAKFSVDGFTGGTGLLRALEGVFTRDKQVTLGSTCLASELAAGFDTRLQGGTYTVTADGGMELVLHRDLSPANPETAKELRDHGCAANGLPIAVENMPVTTSEVGTSYYRDNTYTGTLQHVGLADIG